jgi:hypothetical protein
MLFVVGIYGDVSEVANFLEGNISLWDDYSSWKKRIFGDGTGGAQEKLIA